MTFGLAGGLILMLLGIIFAPMLLQILRTPESVMPQAVTYIRIYLISIPMLIFYNMVSGGMRAYGDSRSPFLVLVACGLLNVVLDALFIVWIPMGVAGAAVGTLIARAFEFTDGKLLYAAPAPALQLVLPSMTESTTSQSITPPPAP